MISVDDMIYGQSVALEKAALLLAKPLGIQEGDASFLYRWLLRSTWCVLEEDQEGLCSARHLEPCGAHRLRGSDVELAQYLEAMSDLNVRRVWLDIAKEPTNAAA